MTVYLIAYILDFVDWDRLVSSPWTGFVSTIISVILGVIVSHYYYLKGKKEGEKSGRQYQAQFQKSQEEIRNLKEELTNSDNKISTVLRMAADHNVETSSIVEVLKTRAYDSYNSDNQIVSHFMALVEEQKIDQAEKFFIAKTNSIRSEQLRNYMQGFLSVQSGQYEEAVRQYIIASTDTPDSVRFYAFLNIGIIYHRYLPDISAAIHFFRKAESIYPDDVNCLNILASCLLYIGNRSEAEEKLYRSFDKDPQNPQTLHFLANHYLHVGNYGKSFEIAEKALSHGAPQSEIYSVMGDAMWVQGKWEESLKYFLKVDEKSPNYKTVLNSIIINYLELGQPLQAERTCELFIRKFPDDIKFIIDKYFILLVRRGEYAKGVKMAEDCRPFESVRQNPILIQNLGMIYQEYGDHDKAKQCFDSVLSYYPDDPACLMGLGMYYAHKHKDFETALEILSILYLNGGRDHVPLLFNLTFVFEKLHAFEDALIYANQIVAIDPNNSKAVQVRNHIIDQVNIARGARE